MRLFIAINVGAETKERLLALCDELREKSQRGNFTLPENLHLTLVFIGEVSPPKKVDKIKAIMDTVELAPFTAAIDRLGTFSRGKYRVPAKSQDFVGKGATTERASFSPQGVNEQAQSVATWWAGLREDKPLMDLQREVEHKLALCGFEMDGRKYRPHITIGREVVTDVKPWQIEPFGETVSSIDLMKSERINGKLTYTSIYRRGKWLSPIVVEPYNPLWEREFERLYEYITGTLGGLAVAVHHVGSTSVGGLAAKPIIDIDIEIASYDVFPQVCEKLVEAGWRHDGDYGISEREAFTPIKPLNFIRHHLYVCPSNSAEMRRHLALRDYLRENKISSDEYGKLKQQLAEQHVNDIDAYIDGKSAFIKKILEIKGSSLNESKDYKNAT